MSTQYNGAPSNVAAGATLAIASSTNTYPIVVTSASAHGLSTGDWVDITDHQVNISANGQYPVIVLTSTTFSIPVSGVGVGGATGNFNSLALGQTYPIPSDGDENAAVSVDVALETLGDRTALLAVNTGALKLAALYTFVGDVPHDTTAGHWTFTMGSTNTFVYPSAGGAIATVPDIQANDVVEIAFNGTASGSPTGEYGVCLAGVSYAPGASPAGAVRIPGSEQYYTVVTSGGYNARYPISMTCIAPSGMMGINGSLDVWLLAESLTAAGGAEVNGEYTLTVKVWRPTNQLQ
jgi:hypothetical protein